MYPSNFYSNLLRADVHVHEHNKVIRYIVHDQFYHAASPLYIIIDLYDLSDCKVVNYDDYTVTAAKLRNQTIPDLFKKYFPNLAAAPKFGV